MSVRWLILGTGAFAMSLFASLLMGAETAESLRAKAAKAVAQLEGELRLPGLKQPVEVRRDQWGIPHIYAQNRDDLFFAQGVVAAQDRLFQIDLWRRVGLGQTAEIFGEEAIEADRFARLIKYRGDMAAEWASYSPDTLAIATSFTSGINAYIEHLNGKWPVEFQVLGYAPAKWRPEDILGRMSGVIMTSNWQREVTRARLVATVGVDQARRIAPTDPPVSYALDPRVPVLALGNDIFKGYTAATRTLRFTPFTTESNNWVVDASKSQSGKPLLASDPHRAITLPSLRYLVHLHAPGWNVMGAGEPALPGVAIGHNERIAWGFTIVGTDQADLFVEQTPPGQPTQYRAGGEWLPMQIVREPIAVRGRAEPVTLELRYTRHGPVIYQDETAGVAVSLKWVGSEPGAAAYLASLAVGRAGNMTEFRAALERWKVPALNFVYADVDGHIGWVAAGATPVRKKGDGLLPVPGASGEYDWERFLSVSELPHSFDPATHWLATANHNILPPDYSRTIAYEWSSPYRFHQIRDRLTRQQTFTRDDFKTIQHDNTSLPSKGLQALLKKVDMPGELKPYAELFVQWNGELTLETAAGALYAVFMRELIDAFYASRLPVDSRLDRGDLRSVPTMLEHLGHPSSEVFGPEPVAARDALLRSSFAKGVARTRELLGNDMDKWAWGKLHTAKLSHPLSPLGSAFAEAFDLSAVSRPGDANSPNNTRFDDTYRQIHGASYRHILDLADWDLGLATSTPGQSGQPTSPFYDNLLQNWANAEYFPLYFSRKKVEEATRFKLDLRAAPQ